jgi:predicted DNA-binding protein
MTQLQRKSSQQQPKIQLAPHQIYVKRPGCHDPVQNLVEGFSDWSFTLWGSCSDVTLYHKGHYVTHLIASADGYVDARLKSLYPNAWWKTTPPARYTSLTEAIQLYEQEPEQLAYHDQWNKAEGLEEWCIRQSFTFSKLSLKCELPPDEHKRLTRLAEYDGRTLGEFALEALYKHLSEVEERYTRQQQWKQRQQSASTESEVSQEVRA